MNVLLVRVPPLRERATDIPLLLRHFMNRACESGTSGSTPTLSREAEECLGPRSIGPATFASCGALRNGLRWPQAAGSPRLTICRTNYAMPIERSIVGVRCRSRRAR